jgi:hypothetical protein
MNSAAERVLAEATEGDSEPDDAPGGDDEQVGACEVWHLARAMYAAQCESPSDHDAVMSAANPTERNQSQS